MEHTRIWSFLFVIFGSAMFASFQYPQLSIVPEVTHMWVLEGSAMRLDCVYTQRDELTPDDIDFYHNGRLVDGSFKGFTLRTTVKMLVNGTTTKTLTLEKNQSSMYADGRFVCRTSSGNLESAVYVHVFRVHLEGDMLVNGKSSLKLHCDPEGIGPSVVVTARWSHNNKSITAGSRYNLNATVLEIFDPTRSDMGEYQCELIFNSGSVEEQRIKPGTAAVLAPPATDAHSGDQVFEEGSTLELWCNATGYPFPTVGWLRNGKPLKPGGRVQLVEYSGAVVTSKVVITSMEVTDKGIYTCTALSSLETSSSASIRVDDEVPLSITTMIEYGRRDEHKWVEIECEVTGYPGPQVTWYKDGRAIKNNGTRSRFDVYESHLFGRITIFPLQPQDYGEYVCEAVSSISALNSTVKVIGAIVKDSTTSRGCRINGVLALLAVLAILMHLL